MFLKAPKTFETLPVFWLRKQACNVAYKMQAQNTSQLLKLLSIALITNKLLSLSECSNWVKKKNNKCIANSGKTCRKRTILRTGNCKANNTNCPSNKEDCLKRYAVERITTDWFADCYNNLFCFYGR